MSVEVMGDAPAAPGSLVAEDYPEDQGDQIAALGSTKHVFIDKDLKPVNIPADIKAALEAGAGISDI